MAPALAGAIDRAAAHALRNPGRRVAVVLITDGTPTECVGPAVTTPEQALAEVVAVAMRGFTATPSVVSHVIAVHGAETGVMTGIDGIAQAGGSTRAVVIDAQAGDLRAQLLRALNALPREAAECAFEVPASASAVRTGLSLALRDADQARTPLTRVASAEACEREPFAWYFAPGGDRIELCPRPCKTARVATDTEVELTVSLTPGPTCGF